MSPAGSEEDTPQSSPALADMPIDSPPFLLPTKRDHWQQWQRDDAVTSPDAADGQSHPESSPACKLLWLNAEAFVRRGANQAAVTDANPRQVVVHIDANPATSSEGSALTRRTASSAYELNEPEGCQYKAIQCCGSVHLSALGVPKRGPNANTDCYWISKYRCLIALKVSCVLMLLVLFCVFPVYAYTVQFQNVLCSW